MDTLASAALGAWVGMTIPVVFGLVRMIRADMRRQEARLARLREMFPGRFE